jgi:hypothetical protein
VARGRRLFYLASIAMILVAALHTFGSVAPGETDARTEALEQAMRAHHFPMGMGMAPSMYDLFMGLTITMSICLLAIGILGLVLVRHPDSTSALLSSFAWWGAVTSGVLTAWYFVQRIPPPMVSMAVVTLLYVATAIVTSPGRAAVRS